jgi:hypothetical protein
MNADTDLERDIREVLAIQMEGEHGEYPRWGDSPRSAAELATVARSILWPAALRPGRPQAIAALVVVAVVLAGAFYFGRWGPGGSPAGGDGINVWAVSAFDENRVIAVGGSQDDEGNLVVARSVDGGRTWDILRPAAPALTTVAVAGPRLFGATKCTAPSTHTEAGVPTRIGPSPTSCLYVSDDSGVSWHDAGAGRLVDPSFSDANHGWARSPVDLDAPQSVFVTADGGRSWTARPSPCSGASPSLQQLDGVAPDLAYALCVGRDGDAYVWEVMAVRPGSDPVVLSSSRGSGVGVEAPATCLTMGVDGMGLLYAGGRLYRTFDGAATWLGTQGGDDMVRGYVRGAVLVASSRVGFAAVRDGGVFTSIDGSTDGGQTWKRLIAWDFWTGEPL